MNGSADEHLAQSAGHPPARCCVLTVSDSRTVENDRSGALLVERLEAAGHVLVSRHIEPDEPDLIARRLESWLADAGVDVVLITGGTGPGPRDRTDEVVRSVLDKELTGFGELFRHLSHRQIGSAAMLSGAVAGLAGRDTRTPTLVFAMPGSPAAVELAMDELIVPQLGHLLWLVRDRL